MPAEFTSITTADQLDALLNTDASKPVVVFQHDPYCATSRRAYREMQQVSHPVAMVDVSRHHEVKRAGAARSSIRHESPQVIVFKQGTSCWSASHGAITTQSVEQALQQPTE